MFLILNLGKIVNKLKLSLLLLTCVFVSKIEPKGKGPKAENKCKLMEADRLFFAENGDPKVLTKQEQRGFLFYNVNPKDKNHGFPIPKHRRHKK